MASQGRSSLQKLWQGLHPHESLEQVNARIEKAKQRLISPVSLHITFRIITTALLHPSLRLPIIP
jgi:hypothetical protein